MQEPIRISYYIDESSHTGDLARCDILLDGRWLTGSIDHMNR